MKIQALVVSLVVLFVPLKANASKIICSDGTDNYMTWVHIGDELPNSEFFKDSSYILCLGDTGKVIWYKPCGYNYGDLYDAEKEKACGNSEEQK